MAHSAEVDIEGRRLRLSNLDKVLYPRIGFTKAQVIDYYRRIAPVLLPHLRNRPLTLKRYPNGVEGDFFFEKQCPSHRPNWVRTQAVWSEGNQRDVNYCLANDLATLVWAANLADLELHTSLSLARNIERPTMMVFDLDPGAPATIVECAEVALELRELLSRVKLVAYAKTSGSKGMQVYVPLNTAVNYDATKAFAHTVAQSLEQQYPDRIVSNMKKDLRKGKVLIDWSQNDAHKTTICVYSLRAKDIPTVSTPVTWDEVATLVATRDATHLSFDYQATLDRVAADGDLFAPVLSQKQRLPALSALTPGGTPSSTGTTKKPAGRPSRRRVASRRLSPS